MAAQSPYRIAHWIEYPWSIGQAVGLACSLEASAPKVGNVHPQASFSDMQFVDFLASAAAIQPVFDKAGTIGVGQLILSSVQATRQAVNINTNLGTLILLAPLAIAAVKCRNEAPRYPSAESMRERGPKISQALLQTHLRTTLQQLSPGDAAHVYQAINLANPGGLGQQPQNDLTHSPPDNLVAAMAQVAEFDAVARQYCNSFADVFTVLVPSLENHLENGVGILRAILNVQLEWLAREPDGLIVRKGGMDLAKQVQRMAQKCTTACAANASQEVAVAELDAFLRTDTKQRNPGTTADLIAATVFVVLVSQSRTSQ